MEHYIQRQYEGQVKNKWSSMSKGNESNIYPPQNLQSFCTRTESNRQNAHLQVNDAKKPGQGQAIPHGSTFCTYLFPFHESLTQPSLLVPNHPTPDSPTVSLAATAFLSFLASNRPSLQRAPQNDNMLTASLFPLSPLDKPPNKYV